LTPHQEAIVMFQIRLGRFSDIGYQPSPARKP